MNENLIEARNTVLEGIKAQLLGPANGENEIIRGTPHWRYLAGVLFPSESSTLKEEIADEADTRNGSRDGQVDAELEGSYDPLPSSMGLTFLLVETKEIKVHVQGARYLKHKHNPAEHEEGEARAKVPGRSWKRKSLRSKDDPHIVTVPVPKPGVTDTWSGSTLGDTSDIVAHFRPWESGHLVSVTLVNRLKSTGKTVFSDKEKILFQCGFRVIAEQGYIAPYPRSKIPGSHEEDEQLNFIYRHRCSYGIGHGCAATWEEPTRSGGIKTIEANPLPSVEVKSLTNRTPYEEGDDSVLDIAWLCDRNRTPEEIRTSLYEFVDRYQQWVHEQASEAGELDETDHILAERICANQQEAVKRMRAGIECLSSARPSAMKAFQLAQRAIYGQFTWVESRKGEPFDTGASPVPRGDEWLLDASVGTFTWRPFQLAFQLLALESIVDDTVPERDLVDLLWFPTGGGKTEAYLALAAFEMFHRRLFHQDSGTAVIMRYTLRLLTSQQFERCSALVSAMEVMRKRESSDLGDAPFRLGLWVGGSVTPNELDKDSYRSPGARQLYEQMLEEEHPKNPFQLRNCPRCGTRIVPKTKSSDEDDYGIKVSATSFKFFCPDRNCTLHDQIPVSVVDRDLYTHEHPTTFVIGTIDKFARLPWIGEPRSFFGTGRQNTTLPPSLIIQDELHLITGPLGTIAGGYEAGIETIIRASGSKPKYIASTATIQRANDQCRALYGRGAFLFPPPGLTSDDSFFSRLDDETPGRTYVGIMGNGAFSNLTTLVQVSAAAAHAATLIPESEMKARDTYWTQVIFHNSRKELGKTTTMLRDDVEVRLNTLNTSEENKRDFEAVEELSASSLTGSEVSGALERLAIELPDPETVDAAPCTNMFSVGVDVGRLGLIIIKSQPKTTAEYIQATSRIGRDTRTRPPGIILTISSPFRPRDRSHYENFQAFHETLYKSVEPSSVTPYAGPARDRWLHATLVLALRHSMGWDHTEDAGKFEPDQREQKQIIETLRDRLLESCPEDEKDALLHDYERIIIQWLRQQEKSRNDNTVLRFNPVRQFEHLLDSFPSAKEGGLWPTLNSMRHVDQETPFHIRWG
jgi:hypothetical protein